MINLDLVHNLSDAVDTIYAAARSELFRPLDQYTRWHSDSGLSDDDFGSSPGRIRYETTDVTPTELTAWAAEHPDRALYAQRIRDTLQAMALEASDEIEDLRNTVRRVRGANRAGVTLERYFLHVEIDWQGEVLVREYAL